MANSRFKKGGVPHNKGKTAPYRKRRFPEGWKPGNYKGPGHEYM